MHHYHDIYPNKDHIKNALTKDKIPPKKWQKYPKKYKISPQFFPLKIQKRPQNDNKAFIVFFGVHFVIIGAFLVLF